LPLSSACSAHGTDALDATSDRAAAPAFHSKRAGVLVFAMIIASGCAATVAPDDGAVPADSALAEASITCVGHPEIQFAPPLSFCTDSTECVTALHGENCCGDSLWVGVKTTRRDAFDRVEQQCRAAIRYESCGCPAAPPMTQDGRFVQVGATPQVRCTGGVCETFLP
jgi:hypothetical protein